MDWEQIVTFLFFNCVLLYLIYEAGQQTSKLKDQVASLQSELEKVKQRLSQI
jgi:hypothetical protein